jgi:hypothetical protein
MNNSVYKIKLSNRYETQHYRLRLFVVALNLQSASNRAIGAAATKSGRKSGWIIERVKRLGALS